MSEKNQTIEEGVGKFDFEQMMGAVKEEPKEDALEQNLDAITPEPEKEPEEPKPEPEKKEEVKQEEVQAKESSNYANLAKKYIENGIWNDYDLEIDGEVVGLSELEDLDEETFLNISSAQEDKKKEDLSSKYINKEDLDDISLKVIDITKNGGDISEVLKLKEEFINPLETYDLTNEKHQEELVRQMYAIESRGTLSQKQIDDLVKSDIKEMVIDEKAQNYADKVKESFNQVLEDKKKEALQKTEDEKKNLKDLRKNLKEEFSKYGMKETNMKPLLDLATNKSKEGFPIEKRFEELRTNPERLAEFLLWDSDPESFKKKVGEEYGKDAKRKVQRDILNLQPKSGQKKETNKNKQKEPDKIEEFKNRLSFSEKK